MPYDNRNRGTIAKNTRKSKDTDADIAGQINVDGRDYWLNGYQRTNGKDGSTFYSLTVKPKQDKQQPQRRQADDGDEYERSRRDPEDTIPF